jgi:cytidylate kinase
MGTVVFPDADVKIFLVADLEERARRRLLQVGGGAGDAQTVAAEAAAIASRDEQDSGRDISPLRRPEGAVEIDTTGLAFEEQVDAIVSLVERLTH